MKFIKLDLLTLLISLFLFASCENTATIGLEVDPSIAIQGDLADTVTITSKTLPEDPSAGNISARFPFGYLTDPTFGTTEASLAMTVTLPNATYVFGGNPVVDSAVLILKYGTNFYGDSTSTYSVDVRQLNFNLARESSFPSTREYTFFPTVIGAKTAKIYPNTPFRVMDVVAGRADTLRTVAPQIRIPLDRAFIQTYLAQADTSNLRTNSTFARYFGGLHLKINKTSSNGRGGIAFFNLTDASSGIAVYYKRNNATTPTTRDTVSTVFPITGGAAPVAATVKHDYTGTPVAIQLANPNPTVPYTVTYLQPLGGLKNQISFPYLASFTTNVGKVAVNKAELVIDLADGSDVIPFNAAPRLSLYRYDIANQRKDLPDNDSGTATSLGDPRAVGNTVFGGYYNPLTRQYIFVVTSYIQDLLDGKTKDYGTFLATTAVASGEFSILPSFTTAARSVIGSFKKNRTATDRTMKLNIYYTKIN